MHLFKRNIILLNKLQYKHLADVATLRSTVLLLCIFFSCIIQVNATNYLVATKTDLQTRMSNAILGDTVIVLNGTHNFSKINLTNNSSSNYSTIISVANTKQFLLNVSANPASTIVQFSLNEQMPNTMIQILNATGKIVDII